MKQLLQTLLAIILTIGQLFAQNEKGTITGKVKDISGKNVEFANITLLNTRLGTTAKEDGSFTLNVPTGDYTVVISSVGFEVFKQSVTVKTNEITDLSIQLKIAETELQMIEVTGRKETDYKNQATFVGSKSATLIKDLPQSVSYVTKELMLDQAAFRVNEVVKNMSGVNQASFYNDLTIRGNRVSGQENYSMLVNGMRSFSNFWKQLLIPHMEQVEVLKGPASALYGNASPGGTVNRVTKKPLDERRMSINSTVGSFGTFRTTADFTGPMNEEKTLLYRLNLGLEDSESFRDLQFDKSIIFAPSFSFLPNDKTRINFDLVYQTADTRLDRGHAVFGNGDLFSVPINKSLSVMNDFLKEKSYNITFSLNHKFSKNISFTSAYMFTSFDEDLLEHRTANTYAKDGTGANIPTQVEMQVFIRKRTWNNSNFVNYFNFDFNLGKVQNKMVVGYDYATQELRPGGSQLVAGGYRNAANNGSISTYVAANKSRYLLDAAGNPVPNTPHIDLTNPDPYALRDVSKYFFTTRLFPQSFFSTQGFYVQDQIKIGKLQTLLGFRSDVFTEFIDYKTSKEKKITQTAFIPRVGLVYSLTNNINTYATYVGGYQPQSATTLANPNVGGPFDPLISNLKEFGFKTEWFDKRLTASMAVYQLNQKGTLYNAGDTQNPDKLVQIGEEVSKGMELDIIGQLATNWNIIVNYAYSDATITASKNESEVGRQKPNAPKHLFNVWTKYIINKGTLSGLGFGVGTNYQADFVGSITPAGQNPKEFPSYQLLNAAVYYKLKKMQLQLNINNVTDKTHWVGGYDYLRAFPGAPRNILATVAYTF
ncbi:MAG: TonB-dependent receptor [Arcicella sp.]|jgi:iron complex outermembrane receptor protein|nr:TonB-dependent receptor [Arcicella sp.]